MDSKKNLIGPIIGIVAAFILVGGVFMFGGPVQEVMPPQDSSAAYEPYRATLTGVHVCLPHKDTEGPQTLECASGIQTDDITYYALDFSMMSQTAEPIENGEKFTATGLVTPIQNLSSDHWRKYNIEGIFSVTDSVMVEVKDQPMPPAISAKKCYIGGCSSQLCTDQPDMASTCEYREEYACYQGATCTVQPDGECGWTESSELSACLFSVEGTAISQ